MQLWSPLCQSLPSLWQSVKAGLLPPCFTDTWCDLFSLGIPQGTLHSLLRRVVRPSPLSCACQPKMSSFTRCRFSLAHLCIELLALCLLIFWGTLYCVLDLDSLFDMSSKYVLSCGTSSDQQEEKAGVRSCGVIDVHLRGPQYLFLNPTG